MLGVAAHFYAQAYSSILFLHECRNNDIFISTSAWGKQSHHPSIFVVCFIDV